MRCSTTPTADTGSPCATGGGTVPGCRAEGATSHLTEAVLAELEDAEAVEPCRVLGDRNHLAENASHLTFADDRSQVFHGSSTAAIYKN